MKIIDAVTNVYVQTDVDRLFDRYAGAQGRRPRWCYYDYYQQYVLYDDDDDR